MTSRKIFTTTMPNGKQAELYGKEDGDLEIYIDGAWGITTSSNGIKFNLFTVIPTEEPIERREVVARLVMSLNVFYALQDFFNNQCKRLEEDGIVVKIDPASMADMVSKSEE